MPEAGGVEVQVITNHDVPALSILMTLVNEFSHMYPDNFPEIIFLEQFIESDYIDPNLGCVPKKIIDGMRQKHEETKTNIQARSNLLKTIVFKCISKGGEQEFRYSNNMSFNTDIVTICYLYHIKERFEDYQPLQHLMRIMEDKYKFDNKLGEDVDFGRTTLLRIVYSFPSITVQLYYYDIINSITFQTFTFLSISDFDIPKAFYSRIIASLIPVLDDNRTPIAVLTAILIQYNDYVNSLSQFYTKIPLNIIYQYIITLHNSEYFPAFLKFELCINWGIVVKEDGKFRYAHYFTRYHQSAKDLIRRLRPDEPFLDNILSEM